MSDCNALYRTSFLNYSPEHGIIVGKSLQRCNAPTLQRSNAATLQRCNASQLSGGLLSSQVCRSSLLAKS
jgi:hypothetical protein